MSSVAKNTTALLLEGALFVAVVGLHRLVSPVARDTRLSGDFTHGERVLVVDDDEVVRDAFRRLLESSGYDVVLAPEGAAALHILRTDPSIRLLLLDLDMPGMNGIAVRQAQLSDPAIATIPTVIVSGSVSPEAESTIRGAHGYLQKPVSRDDLLNVVRRYCTATRA